MIEHSFLLLRTFSSFLAKFYLFVFLRRILLYYGHYARRSGIFMGLAIAHVVAFYAEWPTVATP